MHSQVMECVDISKPVKSRYVCNSNTDVPDRNGNPSNVPSKRCLKLRLTDGTSDFSAIEVRTCSTLTNAMDCLGAKVRNVPL